MPRKATTAEQTPAIVTPGDAPDDTTPPEDMPDPENVVIEVSKQEIEAQRIGAELEPLLAELFTATEATDGIGRKCGRLFVEAILLYPEENGPQWNRSQADPDGKYMIHERKWFGSLLADCPAEDDYAKGQQEKREQILNTVARTKDNVKVALAGRVGGKGLIQAAIVDYCMANLDPMMTFEDHKKARTVDAAGEYYNYSTLPARLVTAIQAEYKRCKLKLPANLGGKTEKAVDNGTATGPKGVTATLTDLSHVQEATRSGRLSIPVVCEAIRTLSAGLAARVFDAQQNGWDLGDGKRFPIEDRVTAAGFVFDAEALLSVVALSLADNVTAEDWEGVNHLIVTLPPITAPTDGIETGAEQTTEPTEEPATA